MPRISSFYGIVIWMYFDEPQHEGRPHFHVTYGDDEASFDIDALELIAGGLPRRAQKMVAEWAKDHQEELRENWSLARDHKPPHPIDPLRSALYHQGHEKHAIADRGNAHGGLCRAPALR